MRSLEEKKRVSLFAVLLILATGITFQWLYDRDTAARHKIILQSFREVSGKDPSEFWIVKTSFDLRKIHRPEALRQKAKEASIKYQQVMAG